MKRFFATLLAALMLVSMIPVSVSAAGTDIAKIGEQGYATLAEAVAAAQDGETVELLANATGEGIVFPVGKDITLDFGGFTYTANSVALEDNPSTLYDDGAPAAICLPAYSNRDDDYAVTLQNGSIAAAPGSGITMLICATASGMTVKNMTLTDETLGDEGCYLIYTYCGTAITGCELTASKDGNYTFAFRSEGRTPAPSTMMSISDTALAGRMEAYRDTELSHFARIEISDDVTIAFDEQDLDKNALHIPNGSGALSIIRPRSVRLFVPGGYWTFDENDMGTLTMGSFTIDYPVTITVLEQADESRLQVGDVLGLEVDLGDYEGQEYTTYWYRGEEIAPIAETPTYTLTEVDLGQTITAEFHGEFDIGDGFMDSVYGYDTIDIPEAPKQTSTFLPFIVTGVTQVKVIDAETEAALEGATFELYRISATGSRKLHGTYTSNATGRITARTLSPRFTYELVMTAAPEGYDLLEAPVIFRVQYNRPLQQVVPVSKTVVEEAPVETPVEEPAA